MDKEILTPDMDIEDSEGEININLTDTDSVWN